MTIRATFHFETNGLWVAADALGMRREVSFRGYKCFLQLPSRAADFDLDKYTPRSDLRAMGAYREVDGVKTHAEVGLVRVDVEIEEDFTAAQFQAGADESLYKALHEALVPAADAARALVASLVSQARVEHAQSWLDPRQATSPRVVWLSDVYDGNGDRIPSGYNDPLRVEFHGSSNDAISAADVDAVLQRAVAETKPSLAGTLLSDALFYAWHATHRYPHLGLMLAAIATEVKVKETLMAVCSPEQRPLVQLILENPRDVSVAASSLFDKGLKAVAGVSLRDEDRELYKAVTRLFEDRNRFAHKGDVTIEESLIREDLQAARRVATWLDAKRAELLDGS